MPGYVLSSLAQRDIDGIWDYTAEHWGSGQAETYVRDIQNAVETLAAYPRRGRRCDEIRPGYLKYRIGAHMIFFRHKGATIEIVRILHQSMDFERHL